MTAVMKYAGAIALDDLEAQVERGFGRDRAPDGKAVGAGPLTGLATRDAGACGEPAYGVLLRFAAINIAGLAFLGAAWTRGWLDVLAGADSTGLTFAIVAVFFAGFALCGQRLWRLSREALSVAAETPAPGSWAENYLAAIEGRDSGARSIVASALQMRLADWIAPVRHFANSLVLLGLIGTVIGFIISLSGVNPDSVADVKAISPMVSKLLSGMSVALYTTLVGAALNLWLMVDYRLLSGATARLAAALVERGEQG